MVTPPRVDWTYIDGPWVWIQDAYVLPPSFVLPLLSRTQVYGRRLTALVLSAAHSHRRTGFPNDHEIGDDDRYDLPGDDDDGDDDRIASNPETLPFGDNGQARLTSVRCHKHKKEKH
jgi:hypothetical protein